MAVARLGAQDYFRAALEVVGERGSEALTIAVLCERLDVTKGSFYHHFASMSAFVDGLLRFWERVHSELIIRSAKAQPDPGLRIIALVESGVELPHAPEAAIRAWAHSHEGVAEAVARVDRRRDRALVDSLVALGIARPRAKVLSRLGLTLLIGIQNRDPDADPQQVRQLFDEILRLAFMDADPAKVARVLAAAGG